MISDQTRTFTDVFCLSLDWRVTVMKLLSVDPPTAGRSRQCLESERCHVCWRGRGWLLWWRRRKITTSDREALTSSCYWTPTWKASTGLPTIGVPPELPLHEITCISIVRVSQTIKLFSHIQDLFCHVLLRCLERMSDSSPVAWSNMYFVYTLLIYSDTPQFFWGVLWEQTKPKVKNNF